MRSHVVRTLIVAVSFTGPLSSLYAQQGLASAATTIDGRVPAAASARTVVPSLVPYSGAALDRSGRPVTGDISVTFLIFRDQQGGEPLFTETQMISFDQAGRYKAQLGAANPNGLPPSLFSSGEARWLEVQVAGQPTEARVLLASVPYALKAADAATLGGLPASAFALAGSAGASGFSASSITPNATSAVTTTGGTANKIAKFSGTSTIVNSTLFDNGTQVGVGTSSPTATLTVGGTSAFNGAMSFNPVGTATSSTAYDSQQVKMYGSVYNSSSKAAATPHFIWQVEPTGNNTSSPGGTLNLLASPNSGGASETGLYLNTNGTIHFASGQTFPGGSGGSGTITGVTAGTGLSGGGTSGNVSLKVNTAVVPTLTGNNTFTGTDTFVASINENLDINIDNTNKNTGNISPGLRFGNASGEGVSSQRTSGGSNQFGLDLYTDYFARVSITEAGDVGIDATPPDDVKLFVNDDGTQSGAELFRTNGLGGVCFIDTDGDLGCGGAISGNAASFKIDHPLDPANKYLVHSSVASSEMLNIYSGNVTTDGSGSATVNLPDWFEAENGDFRYQLTAIGRDARAWVSQEVSNKVFRVSTSEPNVKVSWQITAARQDRYAKTHPAVVEQEKPANERGYYEHPELFGQPREKAISWARVKSKAKVAKAQVGTVAAH